MLQIVHSLQHLSLVPEDVPHRPECVVCRGLLFRCLARHEALQLFPRASGLLCDLLCICPDPPQDTGNGQAFW